MGLKLSLHGVLCSVKQKVRLTPFASQQLVEVSSYWQSPSSGLCAGRWSLCWFYSAATSWVEFLVQWLLRRLNGLKNKKLSQPAGHPGIALENQKKVPSEGLAQPIVVPEARVPHRWKSSLLVCAMTAAEVMLSFYWIAASQVGDYSGYLAKRCWTGPCLAKHLWSLQGHEQPGVWLVGRCWPQRKAGQLAGGWKEGWAGDGHRRKLSGW
ncbi:hypothetical protein MIR68_002329 [Amoeboaphelidium protococcarum]|nr:hypothetical protein MIR68_002329 [Amoeboaphelidium protococcarum]